MAKVLRVTNQKGVYLVWCLGCDMFHQINSKEAADNIQPQWTFDGNMDNPTFSPSLLVRYPWKEEKEQRVCHSFIKDGKWQYLNDCTHELAGQTVEMRVEDDR